MHLLDKNKVLWNQLDSPRTPDLGMEWCSVVNFRIGRGRRTPGPVHTFLDTSRELGVQGKGRAVDVDRNLKVILLE